MNRPLIVFASQEGIHDLELLVELTRQKKCNDL